jgi:hypothetical protein
MNDSTTAFPTLKSPLSEKPAIHKQSGLMKPLMRGDCDSGKGATPDSLVSTGVARLAGTVRRVEDLTCSEKDRMYAVLARYFLGLTRSRFERDLAEKEWAILLTDTSQGEIQGFSTLMRLQIAVDGRPVVAFFSGDTIIHREYWGEAVLPRLWGRHVLAVAKTIQDARVFWFLISSGYRTYRYLPLFFREFYPTYRRRTPPAIKRVMDALGRSKFPSEYEPTRGVIRFAEATPLRPGVSTIGERQLRNRHVAFFVEANPGHANGDELVCLAELRPTNLTKAAQRMLEPAVE